MTNIDWNILMASVARIEQEKEEAQLATAAAVPSPLFLNTKTTTEIDDLPALVGYHNLTEEDL